MKIKMPVAFFLVFFISIAWAQPPVAHPQTVDQLASPIVLADGKVTFNLLAPNAGHVRLAMDYPAVAGYPIGKNTLAMRKDDRGVWSVTVGPLASDFYSYYFLVDGVRTLDPLNTVINRDGESYMNWAIVPGPRATNYRINDVPHGTVHQVWYPSPTLGLTRRMIVYTPPGYATGMDRYPVFYLLHGGGGDEEAWTDMGRAPQIFDNFLARGEMAPMIVVMVNCNWWESVSPNHIPAPISNRGPGIERFPESLVRDMIPFVDQNFRTRTDRDSRAIAGLSRGGAQTLLAALNHIDQFSWIGVFSGGLPLLPGVLLEIPMPADAAMRRGPDIGNSIDPDKFESLFPPLTPELNRQLNLFYLACGDMDGLLESWKDARKILDDKGVDYVWMEQHDYGHEWRFWRLALQDFAPRLFKPAE